jgi:hypothetical protein
MCNMSVKLSELEGILKENIDIRPHALERTTINIEWLYDCLLNEEPEGVLKQRDDRFRIYYKHPKKQDKYDLVLIIDIVNSSPKIIKVVTTYEQSVNRRVR